MRTVPALLAASTLGLAGMVGATAIAVAGTDEAPVPICTRTPAVVDQGDTVVVRGQRWDPESAVAVSWDGDEDASVTGDTTVSTGEDVGTDDDSVSGDDDTVSTAVETADVSTRGRFRVELTVPADAARGTHSINVTGFDRDGLEASCVRVERVRDHPTTTPDSSQTNGGGTEDTTGTTEGTTPDTSGSGGSGTGGSTTTTSSP